MVSYRFDEEVRVVGLEACAACAGIYDECNDGSATSAFSVLSNGRFSMARAVAVSWYVWLG